MSTSVQRKQAPRLPRPAARYWKGKAPKGAAEPGSDSDEEDEQNETEEGDVLIDGQVGGEESEEEDGMKLRTEVINAKSMTVTLKDVSVSKEGKVIVAGREESGRTALEDGVSEEESQGEDAKVETGESSDESSEYESDSEEEKKPQLQFRPVFVPKRARVTIVEKDRIAHDSEEVLRKKELEAEERRRQSHDMVAESIKRELAEKEKEDIIPDVDDTDGIDPAAEFEAWRLRELGRIKLEKEEELRREEEREEIERRRAMPEEQRMKEDFERAQKLREEKPKGQQKFLQKYWHKGAFHQDYDILKRHDFTEATESTMDVSLLPKVMQVKNFGKRSRTKYTHLLDQDTTASSGGFGGTAPVKAGGLGTEGGGCFMCGGPHLKKDCPQLEELRTGANSRPTGERKTWSQRDAESDPWGDGRRNEPGSRDRDGESRANDGGRSYDKQNSHHRSRRDRSRSRSRSRSPARASRYIERGGRYRSRSRERPINQEHAEKRRRLD